MAMMHRGDVINNYLLLGWGAGGKVAEKWLDSERGWKVEREEKREREFLSK